MTAAVRIGEMFNKMKAASCEECALALAHKHQSQNSDVFGRFFALCDLLKVQVELPKNLLALIPEWPSWTSLQVERAKASNLKEAKLSEEAMQGWHSDITVMCKEGYLSDTGPPSFHPQHRHKFENPRNPNSPETESPPQLHLGSGEFWLHA